MALAHFLGRAPHSQLIEVYIDHCSSGLCPWGHMRAFETANYQICHFSWSRCALLDFQGRHCAGLLNTLFWSIFEIALYCTIRGVPPEQFRESVQVTLLGGYTKGISSGLASIDHRGSTERVLTTVNYIIRCVSTRPTRKIQCTFPLVRP